MSLHTYPGINCILCEAYRNSCPIKISCVYTVGSIHVSEQWLEVMLERFLAYKRYKFASRIIIIEKKIKKPSLVKGNMWC